MKCNLISYNNFFLILILSSLILINETQSQLSSDDTLIYSETPTIVKSNLKNKMTLINSVKSRNCECAERICPKCGILPIGPCKPCLCAPKLICPMCPPLGLFHDVAAKKALQDRKILHRVRTVNNNLNEVLNNMEKYSNNVVKYELLAKKSIQRMQKSIIKAQIARENMHKLDERAFMVGKLLKTCLVKTPNPTLITEDKVVKIKNHVHIEQHIPKNLELNLKRISENIENNF